MVIVPILLRTVLNDGAKISLIGCIVQLYFFATTDIFNCCNQNTINHYFCDYFLLLMLSCSDTLLAQILTIMFFFCCDYFILITGSYICIAHEILKITFNIGRQKAFSTCSSHLAVVSIFYGSLIVTYVVPTRNQSQTIGKLLSLLYTAVTDLQL
ncbi:hypothetical protein XELAEV_18019452mg [Xenopus laevis]|uniref:G-protein coupled receptors family 1 profile domain-containing protein n=1 Tax=Xenopus laevis TaxID=8355 RepID=A0A974DG61_XENLA|nr:hypothetical protein XELAEV_18019452mg [Xenopus laevis]